MKLIVAVNNLGWIGKNDQMLWKCSEDLKHFKIKTANKKCLVGRKTFESLPPLEGRELIVVGKGHHTLKEALAMKPDWCIGGGLIYEAVVKKCTQIHISYINNDSIGDVAFNIPENYKGKIYRYEFKPNK